MKPLSIIVLALSTLALAPLADAGSRTRLLEFVAAQDGGTGDGMKQPDGDLFVPPVPNFFGWDAPDSPYGLSIDFTGLANQYTNADAGTRHLGWVKEQELPDGSAHVTVKLITIKAVAWMIDLTVPSPNPFGCNPTAFGTRWDQDGNFDGPLALGSSILVVEYINPAGTGEPMPNLFDFFGETDLALLKLSIRAVAIGETNEGNRAIAGTMQLWEDTDDTGTVLDNDFSIEKVFLRP